MTNFQLLNAESKSAKITKSLCSGGGGGIWCCHIVCIWGELINFDKTIYNFRSAFASQIVSLRKLNENF